MLRYHALRRRRPYRDINERSQSPRPAFGLPATTDFALASVSDIVGTTPIWLNSLEARDAPAARYGATQTHR